MPDFLKNKIISITGGNGFLGKHVIKRLEQRSCKKILAVDRKKYNLVDGHDVQKMYQDQKPDIVFHLAAAVGGIGVNQRNPGRFFYDNAMMNLQVIHGGYVNKIEKIRHSRIQNRRYRIYGMDMKSINACILKYIKQIHDDVNKL